MAVMAFAAQHVDALEQLKTKVPDRLARNNKLARALRQGYGGTWLSDGLGPLVWGTTLPLDAAKIEELMRMIVQGLANFHFNVVAAGGQFISYAAYVTREGDALLEPTMFAVGQKVSGNLGNGTFVYTGIQSQQTLGYTVWRMRLCAAQVVGAGGTSDFVYGFTAPRGNAAGEAMLGMLRGR